MLNKRHVTYGVLPFLVALFPVLSLYQRNIHEVSLDSLFSTVPQVLLATGVTYVVLLILFRNVAKASQASAFAVFYYFSYGVFEVFISYMYLLLGFFGISPIIAYRSEAILSVCIYTVLYLFLASTLLHEKENVKTKIHGASFSQALVVIFCLFNLINLGFILHKEYTIRSVGSEYNHLSLESSLAGVEAKDYPDIYYFILDRYARDDILRRDYDFSNTEFISFLEEKDFFVLHKSRTNYPKTYVSVASSLNGQHLKDLLPPLALKKQDQTVVYEALKDNWVLRLLKSKGYHTYHLGGWWGPTRFNKYADSNVSLYAGSSEFLNLLLNTTINKGIRASVTGTRFRDSFLSYPEPSGYDNFLYETDFLKKLSHDPQRTFAFMHVLSIHEPYFFDEGCRPGGVSYTKDYDIYLRQLKCTNDVLENMVDTIVSESTDPVIIILQSDEGPITYDMDDNNWLANSPAQLQRHLRIFNAIYSTHPLSIYEGMTPVNTFRIIGHDIFGMDLNRLSETSYAYASHKAPLSFTDVTNIVTGESSVRFVQE